MDAATRASILALWLADEDARTPEAMVVKAVDKLETARQHNQGAHPADVDPGFNLGGGRRDTDASPLFATLRTLIRQHPGMALRDKVASDAAAIVQLTDAVFRAAPQAAAGHRAAAGAGRSGPPARPGQPGLCAAG